MGRGNWRSALHCSDCSLSGHGMRNPQRSGSTVLAVRTTPIGTVPNSPANSRRANVPPRMNRQASSIGRSGSPRRRWRAPTWRRIRTRSRPPAGRRSRFARDRRPWLSKRSFEEGVLKLRGWVNGQRHPTSCTTTSRLRARVSNSTSTICCQVPRHNPPLSKGIEIDGPSIAARTWLEPLSSPQRR